MHSSKTFRRTRFPKNNETSLVSVDKNSSRGGVVVGNRVVCLGVVMDTGWHRAASVPMSHFGEDWVLCLGRIAGRVPMS